MKPFVLIAILLAACSIGGVLWYVSAGNVESESPTANTTDRSQRAAGDTGQPKRVEPPEIDTTDVDPAVVKAVRSAQTEVKTNPHSAEAWGKLGMALLAHEFETQAVTAFVEAEKLDPKDPRWPYLHGRSIIRTRPEEALPLIARAADLTRDAELAPRLRLFELYLELDRPDELEKPLKEFLARHPDSARAHVAMARLALRRGDFDLCEQELKLAEGEWPAEKAIHELRAEVAQRRGDKQTAEAERRLAAAAPAVSWPDAYQAEVGRMQVGLKVLLSRADKMFVAGKTEDSAALAEQILDEYSDSEWAWIILGRAQIKMRQLERAEHSLTKALEVNPESVDARFRLGVVYSLRALPSKAIEAFKQVIAAKPDHPVAHYNLAMCYERKQEPQLAEKHFRKAMEYETDYFDAYLALARLLITQGRSDEARPLLERAAELRPNDEAVKQLLASLNPTARDSGK